MMTSNRGTPPAPRDPPASIPSSTRSIRPTGPGGRDFVLYLHDPQRSHDLDAARVDRAAPSGPPQREREISTFWFPPAATSTSALRSLKPGRDTVTVCLPGETATPRSRELTSSAVPTKRSST